MSSRLAPASAAASGCHPIGGVATFVVVALVACHRSPPPPPSPPPAPGICAAGPVSNSLPMNSLPMNSLPMNGLDYQTLQSTQALFQALVTHPLTPTLFAEPSRASLLAGDHAVDLTEYIARCALDPCEWIDAPPDLPADQATRLVDKAVLTGVAADQGTKVFVGELGLCSERHARLTRRAAVPAFRWTTAAPATSAPDGWQVVAGGEGEACLQRVSACLLARTNAVDARVQISLRGDGTDLADRVPVNTMFREDRGTPIVSFAPCATAPGGDPRRNCDWQPHYVGRCTAGRRVTLEVATPRRIELRVCAGVYGCDSAASPRTQLAGPNPPFYAGGVIPHDGDRSFDCPNNGPAVEGQATGYFAVMYRARDGRALDPAELAVRLREVAASPTGDRALAAYPATEAEVFMYREGSFYGNLFVPMPPPPDGAEIFTPEGDAKALFDSQFACYSDVWSADNAMLSHRLCAGPVAALPEGCFGNPPGACDPTVAAAPRACVAGRPCLPAAARTVPGQCSVGSDRSTAAVCRSRIGSALPATLPARTQDWQYPLTTYLNHPCDLFADRETCLRNLAEPPPGPIP